jgi:pimeloyl-ACP methyl ester carboxylesterase
MQWGVPLRGFLFRPSAACPSSGTGVRSPGIGDFFTDLSSAAASRQTRSGLAGRRGQCKGVPPQAGAAARAGSRRPALRSGIPSPPEGTHQNRDKAISVRSYAAQLRAIHRWGLAQPADLSVIHQPVLIANGESGKVVPTKNSADLARRLPDSELVTYPEAGHGGIFQYHAQFVHKPSNSSDGRAGA